MSKVAVKTKAMSIKAHVMQMTRPGVGDDDPDEVVQYFVRVQADDGNSAWLNLHDAVSDKLSEVLDEAFKPWEEKLK